MLTTVKTIEDVRALPNEELHRRLSDPEQRDEINRVIREDQIKRETEKAETLALKQAAASRGLSVEDYKVVAAQEATDAVVAEADRIAAEQAAVNAANVEAARVAAAQEADMKAATVSSAMASIWKVEDEGNKAIGVTTFRDANGVIVKLVEDYQVTNEDGTALGRPTHLEARNWSELTLKKREAHIQATRAFNRLKAQKLSFVQRQQREPEPDQGVRPLTDAEVVEQVKDLLSEDSARSQAAAKRLKDTDPSLTQERLDIEKTKIKAAAELVTLKFLQNHLYDFNNCEANRKILGDYFQENGLEWTLDNLEIAFQALDGQLAPVVQTSVRTASAVDNQPASVYAAQPQPAARQAASNNAPTAAAPAATASPAASAQPVQQVATENIPSQPRPGVNGGIQPGQFSGRRPETSGGTSQKLTKAEIIRMASTDKERFKRLVHDPKSRAEINAILAGN